MLDAGSPPDIKEGLTIGGDVPAGWPYESKDVPDLSPTLWPALPGFREAIFSYYDPVQDLGLHLMRLLALSLDMPWDFFDEAYRWSNSSLRMLRYPPQPANAAFNQLGAGAHTDWGAITILAQDACGGLEVQNSAGDWLSAKPIPETFVVNLGDMVARWTNDLYHSNMHRVMNNVSNTDRYSVVLFYNPNYFTRVECLPSCAPPDGPPKYAPCQAGEHINERRMIAARRQGEIT